MQMNSMTATVTTNSRRVASQDRRRFHRIEFDEYITARFGGEVIALSDFGITGAGFIGDAPTKAGRTGRLEFELYGVEVSILCEVRSCCLIRTPRGGEPRYRAGVRFCDNAAERSVRELMLELVMRTNVQRQD